MKNVGQGKVKDEGKVWFKELQDKRTLFGLLCVVLIFVLCSERSSKVHLYYCMKNCSGSPEQLRESIMNYLQALSGNKVNSKYFHEQHLFL